MQYYEVIPADSHYRNNTPLTYGYDGFLAKLTLVTIPLKNRLVTGIVLAKIAKPDFTVRPVKTVLSSTPLPGHCFKLAKWLSDYYCVSLSEALAQYSPAKTVVRRANTSLEVLSAQTVINVDEPLTCDQEQALSQINTRKTQTVLLHGETGSGKTRVYIELAKKTLRDGKSVIILTPEISLTTQLATNIGRSLDCPVFIVHSQLSQAARKKIWFKILESNEPSIIIGPRSAIFSPVRKIGLIVVDETHEPAYKQDRSPRYLTTRVASQLGIVTGSTVVFGSATPSITDYYLASEKLQVIRMTQPAVGRNVKVKTEIVDIKDRSNFRLSPYLSNCLLDAINTTLSAKKQVMIYLNRRGSSRLVMCTSCGWQLVCPNCDIPLVYHADQHLARCHICNFQQAPPTNCPKCSNPDLIFKTIGSKALYEEVRKCFPNSSVSRFDGDNAPGERLNDVYSKLVSGKIDILVGTQMIAKGLDLPKLGLVGVVAAESSLGLPDYSSEERAFQLLYQVAGRVGRGHGDGHLVIQSYDPSNIIITAAAKRDYLSFYNYVLAERKTFKFPPFAYLMQLVCRGSTEASARSSANNLKSKLAALGYRVEFIGPSPMFYARRGNNYYYQLVVKSKQRSYLQDLAKQVPTSWQIDLDPTDLL